jgi:prolyl-tRNA synthetase
MKRVPTPGKTRCEDVAQLLSLRLERTVKAIAVVQQGVQAGPGTDTVFCLALLRGDHELNEVKLQKIIGEFRFAQGDEIERHLNCPPGYIGPVGVPKSVRLVADLSVGRMSDFVCGANVEGFHLTGVNWVRDLPDVAYQADLRKVVPGARAPTKEPEIVRIEVGHIFQLRNWHSEAMKALFLDESGMPRPLEMGCYGIGITRIVGAAIEQNHDERGIVFPQPIAPFHVALVPIGYRKSAAVRETAEALYLELSESGVEVLIDDRDERPGVMFADMELMGIPHRIVVGERSLREGVIEYQGRRDREPTKLPRAEVVSQLRSKLC